MVTSSALVGTCGGDQLPGVFQFPPAALFQPIASACTGRGSAGSAIASDRENMTTWQRNVEQGRMVDLPRWRRGTQGHELAEMGRASAHLQESPKSPPITRFSKPARDRRACVATSSGRELVRAGTIEAPVTAC